MSQAPVATSSITGMFDSTCLTFKKILYETQRAVISVLEQNDGQQIVQKVIKKDFSMVEVNLMKKLSDHPSFVHVFGYSCRNGLHTIYTEYCAYGDLFEYQDKEEFREGMPEPIIKHLFCKILEGVSYLHSNNICHRDIKPENIFMMSETEIKIGDFGHATEFRPGQCLRKISGTTEYMAPEIIKGRSYSYKVDIWSLGVLLFTLFNHFNPFLVHVTVSEEENYKLFFHEVSQNIVKMNYGFTQCPRPPPNAWNLIMVMMAVSSQDRPDCHQLLKHEWFQVNEQSQTLKKL